MGPFEHGNGLGLSGSEYDPVMGPFEHGNGLGLSGSE
jgi:hypothetical protein